MSPDKLVVELATAIRERVRPRLGLDREIVGVTESGDATFRLDHVAEAAVAEFMAAYGFPARVFSEDRGLVGPADADYLLVVDPIDGTRPAKAGLEGCCVSVALARNVPGATLADVHWAAVYELQSDRLFTATRGGGTRVFEHGREVAFTVSDRTELTGAASSIEITGRPVVASAVVLEELVDGGSLRGGCFVFASSTFALTRLVLGQLDCHADVADRLRRDLPALRPAVNRAGVGRPIALFVYDLAAVHLIATEAGITVSDAYGQPLDAVPLTELSLDWHLSCVAAATPGLHRALLDSIERGMVKARSWWESNDE